MKNDRPTGQGGGVAFLVKHGLVVNKEYRNNDFNIITDDETLAVGLDFLITKTSLWQPFTARMENLTWHCFKPLRTYLTMS